MQGNGEEKNYVVPRGWQRPRTTEVAQASLDPKSVAHCPKWYPGWAICVVVALLERGPTKRLVRLIRAGKNSSARSLEQRTAFPAWTMRGCGTKRWSWRFKSKPFKRSFDKGAYDCSYAGRQALVWRGLRRSHRRQGPARVRVRASCAALIDNSSTSSPLRA